MTPQRNGGYRYKPLIVPQRYFDDIVVDSARYHELTRVLVNCLCPFDFPDRDDAPEHGFGHLKYSSWVAAGSGMIFLFTLIHL